MNSINNYNSPSFGMALKPNREGLKKYINGMPKRIEELVKYGEDARKADKKLIRTMEKELKEAGVTEQEMGGLNRYIPNTYILEDGSVVSDKSGDFCILMAPGETFLEKARNFGCLTTEYDQALQYFRSDLQGIIQKRAEAAKEARINKAVDDLMAKYGEESELEAFFRQMQGK